MKMTKTSWRLSAALVCFSASVVAAPVSMTLTSAGSNVLAGVYIGPYYASINGSPSSVPAICDDFVDDTYVYETWLANEHTFNSYSDLVGTRFYDGSSAATIAASQLRYNEAAWLAIQLLSASPDCPNGGSGNCRGDIQYALWQLFPPNAAFAQLTAYGATVDKNNAQIWLDRAASQTYYEGEFSNFKIYTYVSGSAANCGGLSKCTDVQEFLVRTPEPPVLALLGMDLSAVGALVLLLRRRAK